MTKKIKIIAATQEIFDIEDPPVPSFEKIPEWYKKTNLRINEKDSFSFGRNINTFKSCQPFLDALTTGYMVSFPQDILIKNNNGVKTSQWAFSREDVILDIDEPERIEGLPVPHGYNKNLWRMNCYPSFNTPIGSSILITHPFNRYELPFLTLSAVVDTDKFKGNRLVVSMFIREDFEGIIEKGTPVAQIFPFIRENWESSIYEPYSPKEIKKYSFNLLSIMKNSYKKQFWSKKTYK